MMPKFRAWNTKTKRYVDLKKITALAIEPNLKVDGIFLPFDDSIILEQWTGLTDKYGKEDWIGDIVKVRVGQRTYFRKIYQAESGAFCIKLPVLGATGGEEGIMLYTIEHENIGTIHENPELMRKE